MASVAIITARGGSKRIPRKNARPFMGKPMVCYAVKAAIGSRLFDEVMVSTDDAEIAEIACAAGAQVPFMRSAATANDFATTRDVLLEVVEEYAKRGKKFDEFACIYPCVPLLTADILVAAHGKFVESNADSLMPVVRFSFPVQRAVRIDGNGYIVYREPEHVLKRSQDLEPAYHDVGMFYFYKTASFLSGCCRIAPFVMPEECVQDIDTLEDWRIAEMKFKLLHAESGNVQDRS